MKKFKESVKKMPTWMKCGMIAGIAGLIVTLMNQSDPSGAHISLVTFAYALVAYAII